MALVFAYLLAPTVHTCCVCIARVYTCVCVLRIWSVLTNVRHLSSPQSLQLPDGGTRFYYSTEMSVCSSVFVYLTPGDDEGELNNILIHLRRFITSPFRSKSEIKIWEVRASVLPQLAKFECQFLFVGFWMHQWIKLAKVMCRQCLPAILHIHTQTHTCTHADLGCLLL